MPPRKSDISKAATGDEGATPAKDPARDGINVEDLNLPKSIVSRLAKGVLPPNTQIQGNAMLAMSKSATVFVNYLASHANENAQAQSRKTISPQDVFKALDDLEFQDFKPRLEAELAKFNEVQADKRNAYRKKVAADKALGKPGSPQTGEDRDGEGQSQLDVDGQPATKKARRETGDGVGEDAGEMQEGDSMIDNIVDEDGEDEGAQGDDAEEEDDDEAQEQTEAEEQLEELEEREGDDEALDNGEDSD